MFIYFVQISGLEALILWPILKWFMFIPDHPDLESKLEFELRTSEVEYERVDGAVQTCHDRVTDGQEVRGYVHLKYNHS